MKKCELKTLKSLANSYAIDQLELKVFPGKTTQELIGPGGEIHKLMAISHYDFIFLVSGANDFNRNQDFCPILKCKSVARTIEELLHLFSQNYPSTQVVFAPIPMRQVSQNKYMNERFSDMADPVSIKIINQAIVFFQNLFTICPCHSHKIRFVTSPTLDVWSPFLKDDGLHLISDGQQLLIDLIIQSKPSFSLEEAQFPPMLVHCLKVLHFHLNPRFLFQKSPQGSKGPGGSVANLWSCPPILFRVLYQSLDNL